MATPLAADGTATWACHRAGGDAAGLRVHRHGAGRIAPFFLWYAPMMPHSPHDPPERLLANYRDKAASLEIAKYWAMCEWFDETCGQLLDFIEMRKLADDTLVIFLADNGWIQDPEADRFAPRSKQSPYDGGLRTPILVRWPGKAAPRTCDIPVSAIDVAPTIRKAAVWCRKQERKESTCSIFGGRRPAGDLRRDLHGEGGGYS